MSMASRSDYARQLLAAGEFLSAHDDYLVVAHVQPDGDAAASTAAMGWILRRLGKSFTLANEGAMPEKFRFLPGIDDQIVDGTSSPLPRLYDVVITVDCADFTRIGTIRGSLAEEAKLLNIDHHPTNDQFGTLQLIDPGASATVEILYDLAISLNLTPDSDFATLIYAGLLTDTGGFRYSSTSPKVMRMAASLLESGAPGSQLADQLLERLTYEQVSLLQKGLSTLSFSEDRKIAWIVATTALMDDIGASGEDLDGLINYPRNIEGVEVGMLLKQRGPTEFKVSLRSAGIVDVASIAKGFGGGGHVRAAGCTMHGNPSEIVASIVREVGKQLP